MKSQEVKEVVQTSTALSPKAPPSPGKWETNISPVEVRSEVSMEVCDFQGGIWPQLYHLTMGQ